MVVEIARHITQITDLCVKHKVKSLSIIDSPKRNISDVNFLIRFEENIPMMTYPDNYCALVESFKSLLNKNVDLIFEKSLASRQELEEIKKKKRLLFEA